MNDAYLRSCHRGNDSLCPIFRLGDIVQEAGEKFSEMAVEVEILFLCFGPPSQSFVMTSY